MVQNLAGMNSIQGTFFNAPNKTVQKVSNRYKPTEQNIISVNNWSYARRR